MSKYTLLNAVTATGAVPGVAFSKNPETLNFQVVDTGAATQITIVIETSNDDTVWDTLLTHDVTASGDSFQFSGNPGSAVRANLTVLTAGTAPTVTLTMVE